MNKPELDESPDTAAARWLARLELGLLERDEMQAFERWRAQPQNEAAWSALRAMFDDIQTTASQPGIARMRSKALAQKPRGPLLLGNVPAGIAAAVAAAFVLIVLTKPPAQVAESFYETKKGERRTITLDDGSVLKLNTATRVQVSMTAQERNLALVRGQALFEVAKRKDRPFKVTAGSVEVTALGTQFDIRVDGQEAKVVLIEGRVLVEPLTRRGLARVLPMIERRYLKAGEQLLASDDDNKVSVAAADIEQSTSWQYDRLIFRGETLGAAVAEFNRYNERQLAVADDMLARLPVSGVFSPTRPENFLAAVAAFYPVRVEERSPGLIVLAGRAR